MKLKYSIIFAVALVAVSFLFGYCTGHSGGRDASGAVKIDVIEGAIPAVDVAAGMTETKSDTIYVPVPVPGPERIVYSTEVQPVAPDVMPIETVPEGAPRDSAIMAAIRDWNVRRSYRGVILDDPAAGTVSYSFDVQYNRVGQIDYRFEPAEKPPPKLRPAIGGEYYSNGQYAFGGGVQYGAFGLNVRALKLPASGFAVGIGAQIVF